MDPESAWEYEAGIIKTFKTITLRAAGWYYDIENFINDNGITAPGMGLGSNCLYNIDHMRLYGGELEASMVLGRRLRATASYVWQHYSVDDTGYEEEWTYYLPALLPRNKVKLLARYMVWDDGWFQLSSRFVDQRKTQKSSDEKLDAYVTVDVGFEQQFAFGGLDYVASLFVNNVTGASYQEQAGYRMPKQVWGFHLGVKF